MKKIIINVSKTLEEIVGATTKTIANQVKILNSCMWIVLDNRIALDHILAKQGGACSVITWIKHFW